MSGDKIYEMLKKDGLSDNHFDVYAESIRKRDHPTAEELVEKEKEKESMDIMIKERDERIRQREENIQLGIKTGSSARLDRLKAKHR